MLNSELISLLAALSAALVIVPLAWKWQLGVRRCAFFSVACACCLGAINAILASRIQLSKPAQVIAIAFLTFVACAAVLLFRFCRDPERSAPEAKGAIVSPADGQIIYVQQSQKSLLPVSNKQGRQYTLYELTRTSLEHEDCIVVGIAMNYLDVHVNRSPIGGTVALCRHFPGKFGSLREPAMVFENERATTVIRNGDIEIAVVQIASRLVRQIVSYVKPAQVVRGGERIGAIRLGSQVDLVIPAVPGLTLQIDVGDRVIAGESIIGVLSGCTRVPAAPAPIEEPATR